MSHMTKNYGCKILAKGLLRDPKKHELFLSTAQRHPHTFPKVPAEFDLRNKVAPPENQMACGGCWAFSVTNSLRSMMMLAGKDPGALSKNYLLDNAGPVKESGCSGGDFDAGLNMLYSKGPCLESLSPFTGSESTYPKNAPVVATAKRWVRVGTGREPTAQELCEAIWNNGKGACLSVDIAADSTIENYAGGVITRTTSITLNHMVRLVGWKSGNNFDMDGNSVFDKNGMWRGQGAYFIMRNNWAEDWGLDGDCYIAFGVNNLAETAFYFSED